MAASREDKMSGTRCVGDHRVFKDMPCVCISSLPRRHDSQLGGSPDHQPPAQVSLSSPAVSLLVMQVLVDPCSREKTQVDVGFTYPETGELLLAAATVAPGQGSLRALTLRSCGLTQSR